MDYVPVYAVDKAKISALVPEKVRIKLKKRAKERSVSLSNYVSAMLYVDTINDPWTKEDEAERIRIINDNMRKRKIARARRKGEAV